MGGSTDRHRRKTAYDPSLTRPPARYAPRAAHRDARPFDKSDRTPAIPGRAWDSSHPATFRPPCRGRARRAPIHWLLRRDHAAQAMRRPESAGSRSENHDAASRYKPAPALPPSRDRAANRYSSLRSDRARSQRSPSPQESAARDRHSDARAYAGTKRRAPNRPRKTADTRASLPRREIRAA